MFHKMLHGSSSICSPILMVALRYEQQHLFPSWTGTLTFTIPICPRKTQPLVLVVPPPTVIFHVDSSLLSSTVIFFSEVGIVYTLGENVNITCLASSHVVDLKDVQMNVTQPLAIMSCWDMMPGGVEFVYIGSFFNKISFFGSTVEVDCN